MVTELKDRVAAFEARFEVRQAKFEARIDARFEAKTEALVAKLDISGLQTAMSGFNVEIGLMKREFYLLDWLAERKKQKESPDPPNLSPEGAAGPRAEASAKGSAVESMRAAVEREVDRGSVLIAGDARRWQARILGDFKRQATDVVLEDARRARRLAFQDIRRADAAARSDIRRLTATADRGVDAVEKAGQRSTKAARVATEQNRKLARATEGALGPTKALKREVQSLIDVFNAR